MKTGLILGKFAPLHLGHQHLIETALREMDKVVVLIYDVPDVIDVPLPTRSNWIRQLYPQVEVLEAWDGPLEVSDDPAVTAAHDAYLKQRLREYLPGGSRSQLTHFYCSEFYGEHVSRALQVIDRRVDPARATVPVSGSAVRGDVWAHRNRLSPVVYRDLIQHVVFMGAPSTGKTTLCQALAARYETVWVPEYGRDYWQEHQVDRRLTLEQLWEIGIGHREREDAMVMSARRFLFIDTEAIITRCFSHYYHDASDPRLDQLADEAPRRYDHFFLCLDDIPYDDTWDRSGAVFREAFQRRIEAELRARHIPFTRLGGTLEQRMQTVEQILRRPSRP